MDSYVNEFYHKTFTRTKIIPLFLYIMIWINLPARLISRTPNFQFHFSLKNSTLSTSSAPIPRTRSCPVFDHPGIEYLLRVFPITTQLPEDNISRGELPMPRHICRAKPSPPFQFSRVKLSPRLISHVGRDWK